MKIKHYISFLLVILLITPLISSGQDKKGDIHFDFYGDSIFLQFSKTAFVDFNTSLSRESINEFNRKVNTAGYESIVQALLAYKEKYRMDDWIYYQLIRRTAQQISPKADNYHRYTLYKWFFLTRSGYDAVLNIYDDKILFYVQCDENIYNIPYRVKDDKQYVCLNYHDYGIIDFEKEKFDEVAMLIPEAKKGFSYKVTQLPQFRAGNYMEKDIRFNYNESDYYFKVKLNPEIKTIFANYPVVDYASYFNIPLSTETYKSLIPALRKTVKGLSTKNGVDYLMRFTRYAFLFEADSAVFGKEKRLSPEQTLLFEKSDCEDRAALFFYLVKEIYNLPMIVVSFPSHVTVAVKFDKPIGKTIEYNGEKYSICEPTPQKVDLNIGQLSPQFVGAEYEIAYVYSPGKN